MLSRLFIVRLKVFSSPRTVRQVSELMLGVSERPQLLQSKIARKLPLLHPRVSFHLRPQLLPHSPLLPNLRLLNPLSLIQHP